MVKEPQPTILLLCHFNVAADGHVDFKSTHYYCLISGLRLYVDKNCALLGYYASSNGNFLPTFRGNLLAG
jgi:hypothetical protein